MKARLNPKRPRGAQHMSDDEKYMRLALAEADAAAAEGAGEKDA